MTSLSLSFGQAILIPLLTLVGTALFVLLFGLWGAPWRLSGWVSTTSLIVAAVLTLMVIISGQGGEVQGMLRGSGVTALFGIFSCGVGAVAALIGLGLGEEWAGHGAGAYALILLAVSGALVVAQSAHVMTLAIGLSILHVTTSALTGPRAARRTMIIHGAGLACLLLGMSLLYAAAGSLYLDVLSDRLSYQAAIGTTNSLAGLGLGLAISGLGVFLGIVPFHTWVGAICREASAPGGFLISLLLPGAAIAAAAGLGYEWSGRAPGLFVILAALSSLLGYGLALASRRVRDVLAGVWIARAGLLALTLAAVPEAGRITTFYVLASHGLTMVCLWGLVANARRENGDSLTVGDIAGLGQRRPWLASTATLCLLDLAGALPLAGAVGQLLLYRAVAAEGYGWAIIPAGVGQLLAWLLCGRWISAMWMRRIGDRAWPRSAPEIAVVVLTAAGGLLLSGICGEAILTWIAGLTGGM